jgi:hypothetical protein
MINGNMDIVYIRAYNGNLIPIKNVQLVTLDANKGSVVQEIPMTLLVEKLMYHNMNDYVELKDNWKHLDNYDIVKDKK